MMTGLSRSRSCRFRQGAVQSIVALLTGISVLGCTPNEAWRTEHPCSSPDCDQSFLVYHPDYDLAFVEFTERGNLFDRTRKKMVVDHIAKLARSENGVMAVVFVHGWKNNAEVTNANVADFRDLFHHAARVLQGKRRMVGIYVAWRGLSVKAPGIKELTYWERKTAAEQIGKGGVTELLLELEHAVNDARAPNKNVYVVVGHSFGGGIVLSALNEIMLERVVTALPVEGCEPASSSDCACVETRPFGHGVILLNPAIEANEALQLKEAVGERCFGPDQVRLMHVISSDADRATNKAFRAGQWLDMLSWKETQLERTLNDEATRFDEHDLDTITVGNYLPFQTGQLCDGQLPEADRRPECRLNGRPSDCIQRSKAGDWDYVSYVGRAACVPADDRPHHLPVQSNEPLAFIQTDDAFIGDHSDVFTENVAAYLAAIVIESGFKRARSVDGSVDPEQFPEGCVLETDTDLDFDFGSCFDAFQGRFERSQMADVSR